jgi:hypothetical protein
MSSASQKDRDMKKVYLDATAALAGLLRDDMMIMAGGFGLCGIPEALIAAMASALVCCWKPVRSAR